MKTTKKQVNVASAAPVPTRVYSRIRVCSGIRRNTPTNDKSLGALNIWQEKIVNNGGSSGISSHGNPPSYESSIITNEPGFQGPEVSLSADGKDNSRQTYNNLPPGIQPVPNLSVPSSESESDAQPQKEDSESESQKEDKFLLPSLVLSELELSEPSSSDSDTESDSDADPKEDLDVRLWQLYNKDQLVPSSICGVDSDTSSSESNLDWLTF